MCLMKKIIGASTNIPHKKKMSILKSMILMTMGNGIWKLTQMKRQTTKDDINSPYSDFAKVHRCGVLAAENRAGQYKYNDIETAAAHLHGMIDAAKNKV